MRALATLLTTLKNDMIDFAGDDACQLAQVCRQLNTCTFDTIMAFMRKSASLGGDDNGIETIDNSDEEVEPSLFNLTPGRASRFDDEWVAINCWSFDHYGTCDSCSVENFVRVVPLDEEGFCNPSLQPLVEAGQAEAEYGQIGLACAGHPWRWHS